MKESYWILMKESWEKEKKGRSDRIKKSMAGEDNNRMWFNFFYFSSSFAEVKLNENYLFRICIISNN